MCSRPPTSGLRPVAPLAGSVDRNLKGNYENDAALGSLPSRGAWIEINPGRLPRDERRTVAPLAGSVDRNVTSFGGDMVAQTSLPSRGAWIEISVG